MYFRCILYVFYMYFVCILYVFYMYFICILYVFYMYFICILYVFYMYFICILYVFYMYFICILYVFYMYFICILYVFYMYFICILCVFYVYFICIAYTVEEKYVPEKEPTGFFPPPSSAKPMPSAPSLDQVAGDASVETPSVETPSVETPSVETPSRGGIRPDGFVPNSVLIRLLWPQEVLDQEAAKKQAEEVSVYRPPQLTAAQLQQIGGQKKVKYLITFLINLHFYTDQGNYFINL